MTVAAISNFIKSLITDPCDPNSQKALYAAYNQLYKRLNLKGEKL